MQGAQTQSRFRGIGRYTTALVHALHHAAAGDEIHLVLSAALPDAVAGLVEEFTPEIPASHIHLLALPTRISADFGEYAWRKKASELVRDEFLRALRPDIVLVTSLFEGGTEDYCGSIDAGSPYKTAVIIYDLIPLLRSDDYLTVKWTRDWYAEKIEHAKRADLLLSISKHAQGEAVSHLGFDSERICNISAGASPAFRTLPPEKHYRTQIAALGIRQPYLMHSGSIEGRKNIENLLRAFSGLPSTMRAQHQIVLAGNHHPVERERIRALARSVGVEPQLVFPGHLSDEELIVLYNNCRLFVLPSFHEGFGLPALEAMACGAATIGSNRTSIPEVIGMAEALFDPDDVRSMTAMIEAALVDGKFRDRLLLNASERAKAFSWQITAERALGAMRAAVGPNSARQTKWPDFSAQSDRDYERLITSLGWTTSQPAPTDADIAEVATAIAANRQVTDSLARRADLPGQLAWRLEGPVDSSYSLALVNRETARALKERGHDVVLHSTEGPGDFQPDADYLEGHPDIAEMLARSPLVPELRADVVSRNLFPPRVADMQGRLNVLHNYAWEESGFPQGWVGDFNDYLQGITCLSRHVGKVLLDNGVDVPLTVSGCGVDHWERIEPDPNLSLPGHGFRFLHVSSCFPRKGVEALLAAYGTAFTSADDVTLIIKTFANPLNEVRHHLSKALEGNPIYPHVVVLEEDWTPEKLKSLYVACDALVAPSYAEGFGLPLAEAMLSGLPVITTGWGGQMDFCNKETAWLVDFDFAPALTHFGLSDSLWAIPRRENLAERMREVFDLPDYKRRSKSAKGRELLLKDFTWGAVAKRLEKSARAFATLPPPAYTRIGWMSTWNERCGIAVHSEHLVAGLGQTVTILADYNNDLTRPDDQRVVRCWHKAAPDDFRTVDATIERLKLDTLVIQFNYGFFASLQDLASFIERQLDRGIKVIVAMHSTRDPANAPPHVSLRSAARALGRCDRVLVHSVSDANRLKAIGLVANVTLVPLGMASFDIPDVKRPDVFTVASFGFFLPHKGLFELIEAASLLSQEGVPIRVRMLNAEHPDPGSAAAIAQAERLIQLLGLSETVHLDTSFQGEEEVIALLAGADALIFPYQETGESASAAVRHGIATGRPVLVTPSPIFDDLLPALHVLPGKTAADIARGIRDLMKAVEADDPIISAKATNAADWRETHNYARIGKRFSNLIRGLHREKAVNALLGG